MLALLLMMPWIIEQPPMQYNHPYKGQLVETVTTPQRVDEICSALAGHYVHVGACSMPQKNRCLIVIPNTSLRDQYRSHEIGHCNGWRHHPHGV